MENINLLGSEDVLRASHNMASAANDMQRAVSHLESILELNRRTTEDWLVRFEQVVEKLSRSRID